MPSMQDLPNEVLTRIKVRRPELHSLVLVNHHFHEVYIGALYENFTHGPGEEGIQEVMVDHEKGPDDLPDAIRLIQFLNTTFNSPQLARLVKRLEVTGTWQAQLLEWTGGKSSQDTPSTSSKAALSTSQSSFASLLLARLPQVENLNIRLCYLEDNLFYGMGTHQFRSIKISNHYGVPFQTVVRLLGLPYLKSLGFTYQYNTDIKPLNEVPACSSSIEDLQIRQGVVVQELGHPLSNGDCETLTALLIKFKNLKRLDWTLKVPADPDYRSEGLAAAVNVVKASLEDLKMTTGKDVAWVGERLLASLREYPNLMSIDLCPELLLDEPMDLDDSGLSIFHYPNQPPGCLSGFSHRNQPAGYLSGLLPSSLVRLRFKTRPLCAARTSTYWLDLLKDITADKRRLQALTNIQISVEDKIIECKWCADGWYRHCWCRPDAISVAMKKVCKDVDIELHIMRIYGNEVDGFRYLEINDPAAYKGGEVPYSDAYDDVQL